MGKLRSDGGLLVHTTILDTSMLLSISTADSLSLGSLVLADSFKYTTDNANFIFNYGSFLIFIWLGIFISASNSDHPK